MKKLLSLASAAIVALSLPTLTACTSKSENSNPKTIKYEKIELTTENAMHYLALNVTISECFVEPYTTNSGLKRYNISCIATLTTSRATDCHFEGKNIESAYISYDASRIFALTEFDYRSVIYARLDYDGNSSVSTPLWKTDATTIMFPNPTILRTINVAGAASGYVLVQKS